MPQGETILVVDDNAEFRELLHLMLTKGGYQPLLADGAVLAQEMLEENTPALIVLDIMMPGRSGFDLLENLRWEPRFKDIPVIVLSAMSLNEEEKDFVDTFAGDFMDKTQTPDLINRIQSMLGK